MVRTFTNKNGLVLNVNDRVTIDGKSATVVGFHREMLRVILDAMPDATITVDANWHVEKIEPDSESPS